MQIRVCKTSELSEQEWDTFVRNFNVTFDINFNRDIFTNKYNGTVAGESYHSLYINDGGDVVGSTTVIPYEYFKDNETIILGLSVDTFVCESYRHDSFALEKMYNELRSYLIDEGIVAVLGVPNSNSYLYWKKLVGWKDVGDINYWILPVKVGNVIGRLRFINVFSLLYSGLIAGIANLLTIQNKKQPLSKYRIKESDSFIASRFIEPYYSEYIKNNTINRYRIIDEDKVKTAYIISSREDGVFTYRSLLNGVKHLLKQNVDAIIYVGQIRFFQPMLIKVPKKQEPKRLPLTYDILKKEDAILYEDISKILNWDFGLLNYDVR